MSIKLGTFGEFWAIDYLIKSQGYILLFWNYVFNRSQQDLVFLHPKKDKLIFVEVKTVSSLNYFYEIGQTLTCAKLNKRKLAAQEFCRLVNLKNFSNYEMSFGLIKIKENLQSIKQNINSSNLLIEYTEQIDI